MKYYGDFSEKRNGKIGMGNPLPPRVYESPSTVVITQAAVATNTFGTDMAVLEAQKQSLLQEKTTQMTAKQMEIDSLSGTLRNLKSEADTLNAEKTALINEVNQITTANASFESRIEQANMKVMQLESEAIAKANAANTSRQTTTVIPNSTSLTPTIITGSGVLNSNISNPTNMNLVTPTPAKSNAGLVVGLAVAAGAAYMILKGDAPV